MLSSIACPRKPLTRSDAIRMELDSSILFSAQEELMQRPGDSEFMAGRIVGERVRETVLLYSSSTRVQCTVATAGQMNKIK